MAIHIQTNLPYLRKQRRLRQIDIANATGVSLGGIKAHEQGICHPRIATIILLASFYNISIHELCYVNLQDKEAVEAYQNILKERQQLEAA